MTAVNAYPELVRIAQQIREAENIDAKSWRKFVDDHQPQLAAAREALRLSCRVEVRMEKGFYEKQWPKTVSLRTLMQLLEAEGRLATSDEDWQQVLRCGLDLLELGNGTRRGGLMLDCLVGMGGFGGGIQLLRRRRIRFDDAQREALIRELLRLESESESIETIIARDREWERAGNYTNDLEFEPVEDIDGSVQIVRRR